MQYKVNLFKTWQGYEWANSYYKADDWTFGEVENLVDAEAPLMSGEVEYTRYEVINPGGVKIHDFAIGGTGTDLAQILPIKYAALIRLNSDGIKRPSTKYIHGITEAFTNNGLPDSSFLSKITTYGTALATMDVQDSDEAPVTGATFRGFTRRKRLRTTL